MAPSTMKAIVLDPKNKTAGLVKDHPVPKLRPDYILVKVVAVALNPTDWKHIASGAGAESGISGCDYAGIVEEVGDKVTKKFKKGDRICGCAHGGNASNKEDGVFAEYAVVKGDLQMHIPDSLSFEKASTIPLGASTVGQGLYQKALKLNLPSSPIKDKEYVLIYGGSTATGSLAVQYAKLSGYTVLATCSPHNSSFVKNLGATEVFDYRSPNCGAQIRKYTDNNLRLAWDTISEHDSPRICAEALSSSTTSGPKPRYGTILPIADVPRKGELEVTSTLMYTIFNETFAKWGVTFEASAEDFEFAKMFFGVTEGLLREGTLECHPERVGAGGLEGALKGMEEQKAGKVSGVKLVYRVGETP
ncbi:hypothetical protein FKW77_009410 [Venturia effusa]|uniref:Enoyl reductase (ER) domain-containing protein n=1 Tax=Venturia effusa TaxID=50376 RepID=A0A517LEQ9_9PEZI|nr:hypothetical protein FKW77_009410 [Venturia effusa]